MQQSQKELIINILEKIIEKYKNPDLSNYNMFLPQKIETVRECIFTIEKEVPDDNWIPVTDRLPENGGLYLVYEKGYGENGVFQWNYSLGGLYKGGWFMNGIKHNPTHWQPLANPPTIN